MYKKFQLTEARPYVEALVLRLLLEEVLNLERRHHFKTSWNFIKMQWIVGHSLGSLLCLHLIINPLIPLERLFL